MVSQLGWPEDRDMDVAMATTAALGAVLAVSREPVAKFMAISTTTITVAFNQHNKQALQMASSHSLQLSYSIF